MKNKYLMICIVVLALQCIFLSACSSSPNVESEISDEGSNIIEQSDDSEEKDYIELNIEYNVLSDGTAEVLGYSGEGNHATIDSEFDGHKVVRIADSAFEGCTTIESALFWASIENIGNSAFKDCTALVDISIPNETILIDDHAFEGCSSLKDLIIWGNPDIGDYAFAGCISLEEISFSYDTKYVGEHAFDGCTELTSVIVWDDNTVFGKNAFANCPKLLDRPSEESSSDEAASTPTETTEAPNEATPTPTETTEASSESTVAPNLTVDNCADLAALVALKDPCDPSVSAFASKYSGQVIEFDGCITAMQNHNNYDTRYDILINTGDFDPNTMWGPNFRLTDVNASDMDLGTLGVTDVLSVGCNVHVIAEVGSYNSNTSLFELDVIKVEARD